MIKVSLSILAGGKARRLNGIKKFEIILNSERLIDRQLRKFKGLFDEILIISNEKIDNVVYPIYNDIYENIGPLGGIHAALYYAKSPYIMIIPVDMPFIKTEFVKFIVKKVKENNYDIIVPIHDNFIEPLCAVYSKNLIKIIEDRISLKQYAVREIFNFVNVYYCEVFEKYDKQKMFYNINYFDDIEKAYQYERYYECRRD
jgi:molybdopterin-guanine dinucleotide biosynthesis protein A